MNISDMKNVAVCLQIDPESHEWDLSAGSCTGKWQHERLADYIWSILNVLLFLEVNFTEMKASVTLFSCYCFISQFRENDIFSIEMHPCM